MLVFGFNQIVFFFVVVVFFEGCCRARLHTWFFFMQHGDWSVSWCFGVTQNRGICADVLELTVKEKEA